MTTPITTRPVGHSLAVLLCLGQAAVLLFLAIDLVRNDEADWLLREGGSIEAVSAVLLAGAAIAYAWTFGTVVRWHVPVGLLLLSLRELDFDKAFTSQGVLQLKLYTGDGPFLEKIAGGLVVALALVVLARLAWFQLWPWARGMLRGAGWAWTFVLAAALIVIAKSLDGIARKLAPLGINVPADIAQLSGRVEETFELFFALCLIAVVGLLPRKDA